MVLNSRGQVVFYTFMLGIVVIILALAMTPVVKEFTSTASQNSTDTSVGLGCSNSSISDYQKAQCYITDVATPYFFLGLLGLAGIIITARVIFA